MRKIKNIKTLQLTFPGLVLFSLMLTSTQYFGNPIDCTVQGVENKGLVNTFCWTHGTFTVQNKPGVTNRPPTKEELDQMEEHGIFGFAQPGMQNFNPAINERKFYYFYQWVSFVLFLQVTLCYAWLPGWIIKISRAGLLLLLSQILVEEIDGKWKNEVLNFG